MEHVIGVGTKPEQMSVVQVCLRALILYVFAVAVLRLADRRFLTRMSAIDIILGFTIGSMVSRTINGGGPVAPSMVGILVLLLLHRLSAGLSYRSDTFTKLVKGNAIDLFTDGELRWEALRKARISEDDLLQQVREHGSVDDLDKVTRVTLERGGHVSVVKES